MQSALSMPDAPSTRLIRLTLQLTVAGLLILFAAAYAASRRDVQTAEARLRANSRVIETACGPIEYAISDPDIARRHSATDSTILSVHGAGGGYDQGLLMAEPLIAAGYRVIAMSRFGYLRTPMPRGGLSMRMKSAGAPDASPAAQADAHTCLLDALGQDRVAVLGASAGALSSLQLAIRHPERVSALILLVPAAYLPDVDGAGTSVPRGLRLIMDTALRWDFPFWITSRIARPTLIRAMLGTPPELLERAPPEERIKVDRMLDAILPVTARRAGLLNEALVTTSLTRYPLEEIRAPTLIISAKDDLYGTFDRGRYTAGQIAGARFIGFETGGHLLVGRDAEVTREMLRLLRRQDLAHDFRRPTEPHSP